MLTKLAETCFYILNRKCEMKGEKEIYIYGLELIISTLFSMLSISIISIIAGHFIYAVFFFLFFFSLRLFCGGYHAETYLKCFIITNFSFLINILLTYLIEMANIKWLLPFFMFVSFIIILINSPVKNTKHPCSEKVFNRNKKVLRILLFVYMIIYCFSFFTIKKDCILINMSLSFMLVSFMIVIEKIRIKGGKNNAVYS